MKALAVWVLGWVLLAPWHALAQEKVELNTITSVKVNGSTVEITGSKKPNFTTFTMPDPPRLVIDISEAVLSKVPDELAVNNGMITGLRTANYGSEAGAIARVLIGYVRDVETDIQVSGNVLVVKVLDQAGGPLVAQAPTQPFEPDASPSGTEPGAATQAAQAERENQQQAAAESATTAQAGREPQEQTAAAAKAAEEERRQQEEAARAAAAKKAEDERHAQALAAAEEKKRQEEEARAAAEAKKLAEAEEKKRQAEEAEARRVAAAEEKKRQQEEARAAAEAKKLAEAEEKKRRQEEARAAVDARKAAGAEDKRRRAAEAEAARLAAVDDRNHQQATRVANVAPPRREEPVSAPSTAESSVSGRRKTLEIVGFQQQAGASRVYIRTSEPVRYKVSEGTKEIVLELENTQIGKGNNTRALDTSFFDTAVARVDPTVGPDRSVRVSIKLKADVPVRTRQEGNTISLDFPRPPRP